jgi:hydrogenase nickel incorporation protein HypA/HybF
MHELSIAQALVEIVERHAAGRRVTEVEVRVGHLRQVVPGALDLAFALVARDTVAEDARLVLEDVPAAGRCRACDAESELDGFPLVCRACGGWDLEVVRGEELHVIELELEDEQPLMTTSGRGHDGD